MSTDRIAVRKPGAQEREDFLFVFDEGESKSLSADERLKPVKAQLGVHLQSGWLSLYDGASDRAYAARMENFAILKTFSEILGKSDFYSKFNIGGCQYGRYLFGISWSATERYLQYRRLLTDFFDVHRPTTILCAGLSEAHPVDARVFRFFCVERNVRVVELPANADTVSAASTKLWKGCVGAYAGFGSLGTERLFFRNGDLTSLHVSDFPIDVGSGGLRFDTNKVPATCHFSLDGAGGAFASWRFRHLHLPDSRIRLQLVAGGKALCVVAGNGGWSIGENVPLVRLGPIGPMYPGQCMLIKRDKGFFVFDGMPAMELPLTESELPDGLHISSEGFGECYAYLDRILLTETPTEDASNLFLKALGPFVTQGEGASVGTGGDAHLDCASLFHPTPYVAPPINGRVPRLAPSYQDGWDEFWRHGVDIHWVTAQEPWRLDGGLLRSDSERYLYGPIEIDFVPLREKWKFVLDKDFESVIRSRPLLLKACSDRDFVDFFLANLEVGLSTVLAIAGDALRMKTCLDEIRPDALVGARIDNSFPWAVAAAKVSRIPTLSSEISFIYHEIHRIHRLTLQPETTDAISVWGHEHKRRIEEVGLSSPAILTGGLPALDLHKRCPCALDMSLEERSDLANYLGFHLKPGPVVLYGGWFGGKNPIYDADGFKNTISALLEAMLPLGGGNVIIKSIAMDDPFRMRSALGDLDMERVHILHPSQPFHNAFYIALADLHVALPTTMLAESLAQGCPTVALWAGTLGNWYPVSVRQIELLEHIVPVARTYSELIKIVRNVLSNKHLELPDQQAFQELFGSIELDSTGQLALVLNELVRESNRSLFGIGRVVKKSIRKFFAR